MSYMISPKTGRSILINGPTYRKLMREQNREQLSQDIDEAYIDEDEDDIKPSKNHFSRQRSFKKYGKTRQQVTAEKNIPNDDETSKAEQQAAFTSRNSRNALKNNMSDIITKASNIENKEDESALETHLQQLILAEMMKSTAEQSTAEQSTTKPQRKRHSKNSRYEVENI